MGILRVQQVSPQLIRVILSLFLSAGILSAQEAPAQEEDPDERGFRIGVAVDQVFLSVNVRSDAGGFVHDLSKEDFQVYEDGVKQEIVNFYSEGVPVSVVLLIDVSGSTRDSQAQIRRAALGFAASLDAEDKVAIIAFNSKPRLILNWTNEQARVETALKAIYAKGSTVLNDALYVTFDDLLKDVEGKKAVIILTDGIDTGSMTSRQEVLEMAIRSETMVYIVSQLEQYWAGAIGVRMEYESRAIIVPKELTDGFIIEAKRFLERLAHQTGAKVLNSAAFGSLTDVYRQVAEELKNQYYISYLPSNILKDGRWRNVEVSVSRPGVISSTRPGYYAPRDQRFSGGGN